MENYTIGASFCRRYAMRTCIFVLNYKKFDRVNLDKYCVDFDIELCAVKIQNESSHVYVSSVYRAPSGNFMLKLDEVLKSLYKLKTEFIMCGDFNTDYLTDNCRKNQLNSLLNSYNLFSTVDFPTRITNTTKSAIDNIFIDYSRVGKFELSPIYNGISDHDAQIILIHDVTMPAHIKCARMIRKIDKYSLLNFNYSLSFELWKEVFEENDVFGAPPGKERPTTDYAADLVDHLQDIHNYARQHLKLASDRMKTRYDKLANCTGYQEGDRVWLYRPNRTKGKSPKLQSSWEGPYR